MVAAKVFSAWEIFSFSMSPMAALRTVFVSCCGRPLYRPLEPSLCTIFVIASASPAYLLPWTDWHTTLPRMAGYVTTVAMHFEIAPRMKASKADRLVPPFPLPPPPAAALALAARRRMRTPFTWSKMAYCRPGLIDRNSDGPSAAYGRIFASSSSSFFSFLFSFASLTWPFSKSFSFSSSSSSSSSSPDSERRALDCFMVT
mmetsp:Transcript_23229/g.49443  ORF Transcript_23229/g.49443 Transcript_23229/m.49443 type:complete len:201 (+) Transcript_23229:272-874(+)